LSGIDFKLKTYRPTFLALILERNADKLPTASRVMGHASTLTTERYYGRIKASTAADEIADLLDRPAVKIVPV
jgi:integrase